MLINDAHDAVGVLTRYLYKASVFESKLIKRKSSGNRLIFRHLYLVQELDS